MVVVEFHDLGDLIIDPARRLAVLERMSAQFAVVCVHANNHAAVWSLPEIVLPDALEVTYVNRSLLSGPSEPGNAPAELIAACCPDLPDVELIWSTSG
jgi:hypothetical protein